MFRFVFVFCLNSCSKALAECVLAMGEVEIAALVSSSSDGSAAAALGTAIRDAGVTSHAFH